MSYKSVKEILNEVFDSSDSVLKTVYKTDGEVMNMVLDETGDPALKVRVNGLDTYSRQETDSLLSAKMTAADYKGIVSDLMSPLTGLPLKKNLLTQQGQSICTFTRAGTATYRDRYGMLKTAAADTARFNENGLLLEGASTNSLIYSEQFDNTAWTKGGAGVSANTTAVTDPCGTNLADKLVEDTSNGAHYIYQGKTLTSGTAYTLSVFAKAGEHSQMRLYDSVQGGAIFDLVSASSSSVSNGVTTSVIAYSNGWYRCSVTYTANATSTRNMVAAIVSSSATSYTGDGVSGLYLFGAQLEAMPFATSYIPTTAAAATRAADIMSIQYADNFCGYNTPVSVIADIVLLGNMADADQTIFYVAGETERSLYSYNNSIRSRYSSTQIIGAAAGVLMQRVAMVSDGVTVKLYQNGTLSATGAVTQPTGTATALNIGGHNSEYLYGYVRNFRIYDRAFTAQEAMAA